MVVQSTSPFFARHAYWTIDATLRDVGLHTWPYHAYVPRSASGASSWRRPQPVHAARASYRLPMRYLNAQTTREMFSFPPDMQRVNRRPNRRTRSRWCANSSRTGAR